MRVLVAYASLSQIQNSNPRRTERLDDDAVCCWDVLFSGAAGTVMVPLTIVGANARTSSKRYT